MKGKQRHKQSRKFATSVGRALRRAGQVARKTARLHGMPIYVWRNGKVVTQKP